MALHVPTIFVLLMIATTVMAAALAYVARRRHPELSYWSLALMMQAVGYGLLSLQGKGHDLLSIGLTNVAITLSLSLYGLSICRFRGRPTPAWLVAGPMLLALVGMWALRNDYHGRVLFSGLLWLAQCAALLVLLTGRRDHPGGRGQTILTAATVLFMATLLYRVGTVAFGLDQATDSTSVTPVSVATYVSSLVNTLLLATGVMAMSLERAEHRAEESAERYRTLFDAASEGIMVLTDGKIRLANPRICELLGMKAGELTNQAFLEFVEAEDREKTLAMHQQRLRGHAEGLRHQIRCRSRSRGIRWIEVSGVAISWQGAPATLNFVSDVTEQREAADTIRDMAFHDSLTGLPNRRLLIEHLRLAVAANHRSGRHGAVVFMDLDNFKPLNDRHGHALGDQLLVNVAHRLADGLRRTDTAARFGGDEFVLLLTDLSTERGVAQAQAMQLAEKFQALLARPHELQPASGEGARTVTHTCTASMGVVVFGGQETVIDTLLDQADAVMYESKQSGRQRITLAP